MDSGGRVMHTECMRPCERTGAASTPPRLPQPEPPNSTASVLMILVLKGKFRTPDESRSLAHPAVSNGRLYLREQGALYCYDLKKKK